jgi:oligopeptide transport system substrate-binding protein
MQSNNASNDPKYYSDAYDKIMDKALYSTSDKERNVLYAEAEKQLAQDMPIAPIYQYVKARLVSPHVGGFPENNAEDTIYSKDLYIKE